MSVWLDKENENSPVSDKSTQSEYYRFSIKIGSWFQTASYCSLRYEKVCVFLLLAEIPGVCPSDKGFADANGEWLWVAEHFCEERGENQKHICVDSQQNHHQTNIKR